MVINVTCEDKQPFQRFLRISQVSQDGDGNHAKLIPDSLSLHTLHRTQMGGQREDSQRHSTKLSSLTTSPAE